jgi:hypothetical protein
MNNIYALSGISTGNFDNITSTNYETSISKQEILYLDRARSNLQDQIDGITSGTGYITTYQLNQALSYYVLSSYLNSTLNNYVTISSLSSQLTPITEKISNITSSSTTTTFNGPIILGNINSTTCNLTLYNSLIMTTNSNISCNNKMISPVEISYLDNCNENI